MIAPLLHILPTSGASAAMQVLAAGSAQATGGSASVQVMSLDGYPDPPNKSVWEDGFGWTMVSDVADGWM